MNDSYLVRALVGRLLQSALVLFVVLTLVFVIVRATGDPISVLVPISATEQDIADARAHYGLDDPLVIQYGRFLLDAAQLDFGQSFRTGRPALDVVRERIPETLHLATSALVFSVGIGVPVGVLSAVRRGGILDAACRAFALLGQATPNFWLGIMLILLFAVKLRWLPTGGSAGAESVILPSITLGALTTASVLRLTRSGMLDVLSSDFIRTARAKGLGERTVIWRHAVRHALLPVLTVLGVQMGHMVAGTIVVETVFSWPGIGRLMIESVNSADYPVVITAALFVSLCIILANLVVDISYRFVDPRIRSSL